MGQTGDMNDNKKTGQKHTATLAYKSSVGDWDVHIWKRSLAEWGLTDSTHLTLSLLPSGGPIGVFRVESFEGNNTREVFVSLESKGLTKRPDTGSSLDLKNASEQEFNAHKKAILKAMQKPAKIKARITFACLAGAGAIQAAWDAGKPWPLFHPATAFVVISIVAKYILGLIGGVVAMRQASPRP